MEYIHGELSKEATTYYGSIPRGQDGEVDLSNTVIVYNLSEIFESGTNKIHSQIPLKIDIWYRSRDVYNIWDNIRSIESYLSDVIVELEESYVNIKKSNNFMLTIPDENKGIERKELNFIVNYYEK